MCYQVHWDAVGTGAAYGHQAEHRGSVHDLPVADGGEHGSAPLDRDQSHRPGDGEQFAGQVDEVVPLAAYWSAGDDHGPAGTQQLVAGGKDRGESVEQTGPTGVG